MIPQDFSLLAEALRERLAVIADHAHRDRDAVGHLERLQKVSQRIDALVSGLPAGEIDPQFVHYLARRSYDKALAWIEGAGGADG
jgi:hypothetical protein